MNASKPDQVLREPWNDPGATPYIRIQNVSKKFDALTAVDNVSLDIFQGELFCLLGGSGCGKSTLLRMLAGFERPTAGRLFIDGEDMQGIPPYLRPVNMMFQSYALFPHMTVNQNVGFGLKQDGTPRAEIAQRVEAMLEMVQLAALGQRKPHQLSGGQKQRVALARSLIKQPKLLLLDEPLGALDKKLREETQFELVNLQERLGITFVVVTHDQQEAMTLSSRIGVMNAGEIVQVGTPSEIYEYPNSRFTADFIGSVNIFEGRLREDGPNAATIHCTDCGFDVRVAHGVTAAPGATLWVAVRPEKMSLSREPVSERVNCVHGVVDEIAYLGDLSIYHIRLQGGQIVRVTQPNLVRGAEERITWDETVFIRWDAGSVVVLNR